MKVLPINRYRFYQTLQPLFLLRKLTSQSTTGCLQVFTASASWSIYVEEGKIIYACYADKMFDLLYKHLQHLSQKLPTLNNGIKEQLRVIFEAGIENQAIPNPDYLAICWLVNQKYITSAQAGILIEQLALEVLEQFLLLKEGSYEFSPESFLDDMPKFCHLDVRLLVERCQKRSHKRQKASLAESSVAKADNKSDAIIADTDVANMDASHTPTLEQKYLQSSVGATDATSSKSVPATGLERSQKLESKKSQPSRQEHLQVVNSTQSRVAIPTQEPLPKPNINNFLAHPTNTDNGNYQTIPQQYTDKKVYTVLCIDDSPTVANAIKRFLDDQIFGVIAINDPLKALIQVIRLKPDIILLDIEMPNLDGYELCSLVRKHPQLKNIPIIMVTSRTGFIDKARAKIVRASGYLNKPFTQAELLKEIFQHIG